MAMSVRRNFIIPCFYFLLAFFSVVLTSQAAGDFNPSIVLLNLNSNQGSYYLQNEDLQRTVYHLQKRSAGSPVKKATAAFEKKVPAKEGIAAHIDKIKSDFKNASSIANNTMLYNATSGNASMVETVIESELHNASVTNISASSSNLTLVSSTTSSTAVTGTTPSTISNSTSAISLTPSSVVTTEFADILPTKPSNITNTTVDHHVYYNSTIYLDGDTAMSYWIDFDELPQHQIVVHKLLSDSHRKAATVSLTFDFPFYGHPLRNITIATGGFVYMGDQMHNWLAATQYIAPLMANFDTRLSDESTVRYFDNGTAFVIEWHQVTLQDEPKGMSESKGGNFTFQTILLDNGNIIFVYKDIPLSVTEIGDDAHPVKVGLSDAYVIDRIIYFIRRKTIYEYHRIDMKRDEIRNHTAIYFTALTTCLSFRDCDSCMSADVGLNCIWCDSAKRCSDGLDRSRQDWLQSKCDVQRTTVNCSALPSDVNPYVQPLTDSPSKSYTFFPRTHAADLPSESSTTSYMPDKPGRNKADDGASTSARVAEDSSSLGVGSVVTILLILSVVLGGLVWVGYAYRNPHTSSGQLLIRYRPTQWRFRSGEARYTAASVHM